MKKALSFIICLVTIIAIIISLSLVSSAESSMYNNIANELEDRAYFLSSQNIAEGEGFSIDDVQWYLSYRWREFLDEEEYYSHSEYDAAYDEYIDYYEFPAEILENEAKKRFYLTEELNSCSWYFDYDAERDVYVLAENCGGGGGSAECFYFAGYRTINNKNEAYVYLCFDMYEYEEGDIEGVDYIVNPYGELVELFGIQKTVFTYEDGILKMFSWESVDTVPKDLIKSDITGWQNENGKWAYYENGIKLTNQWKADSQGWRYLGGDGYCVTNRWIMDSIDWCYVGDDGYVVTNEWIQDSLGWCYVGNNGYVVTDQWINDGVGLKYVGSDGRVKTNCWGNDSVGSYYFGEDGYIYKNAWFIVDNTYNYVNEEGYCDIKFTFEFVSGTQKDVAITDYVGKEPKLVIPSTIGEYTVVSIGNSAFAENSTIISVEIPDTVKVIGKNAFFLCINFTKVVLPQSLTTIQYGAFSYCTGLININLPESLTSIEANAFAYCSSLEEINIPSGITYIYKDTFSSCSKLARVIIPENVEIIYEYAFGYCSSLVDIWLPVSIDVICKNAFSYSYAFSRVYYAGTETEWNNITIADSKILNNVQIHYNVSVETIDCHWTEYTIDATCTEDGEYGYECPCGYKTSTTIPVIGHDYETDFTIDVEATETTDGSKSRHCKNCDSTTDVTVIPATGIIKNGWVLEGSKWAYYQNNVKVTNKWLMDSVGWCYVGADGYCVTNCWKADSKGWCYLDSNGRMVCNNWVLDNGKWYFMDANGYMISNQWKKDSKGWCYLGSSGAMLTNAWVKDSVGWCYVGADGYCVTNKWVKDSKGWCYLDAQGRMVYNKWVKDSVGWCYVGSNGYMVTSQWVQDGGKWYYIDQNGYMVTGTKTIGGKTYKFNSSGVWIA